MQKFGFEMVTLMGTECFNNVASNFVHDEIVAGDDPDNYDPSKPEFILPATQEEVERTNAILLSKQIAKLEAHASRRKAESKVVGHYNSVVNTLRSTEAKAGGKFTHRRVHSEPSPALFEEARRRPRCEGGSDRLAAMLEESPIDAAFQEDFPVMALDEELPKINAVRTFPMRLTPSMATSRTFSGL